MFLKQIRQKNIAKGVKSKSKGRYGEKVFEQFMDHLDIVYFKIEDGERYGPNTFIRRPQPFDYILVNNGKPVFIDLKIIPCSTIGLGRFITKNPDANQGSTHKQCSNFLKMYSSGYKECYFAVMEEKDLDKFSFNIGMTQVYLISTEMIIEKNDQRAKGSRMGSSISIIELKRIEDVIF